MPQKYTPTLLFFLLFFGLSFLTPITGGAGWFGPATFAECMKEELKEVKSAKAEKYARDYCFDEFCRDKGHITQIDNEQVRAQCQQLAASYREIKLGQEEKRCKEFSVSINRGWCSYRCRPHHLTKDVSSLLTPAEWRCCWCLGYAKESQRIESENIELGCSYLKDEDFVYEDKTCPGA